MNILSSIYRYGSFPLSLIAIPAMLTRERGRARLIERLGEWDLPAGRYLWFHGASLGEVQGLVPLLKLIKARYPRKKILVTVLSVTGIIAAQGLADEIRVLPFDSPYWIGRALRGVEIEGLVITETELWPNLLAVLGERGIPTALINAKISDLTQSKYGLIANLFRQDLSNLRLVLAADDKSKQRFEALGTDSGRTITIGNTKYDRNPGVATKDESASLKAQYFAGQGPVVVLGSLHPDESEVWIDAISEVSKLRKLPRIIIAPRHKEKFPFFVDALSRAGILFEKKTDMTVPSRQAIVLLDTFGELEQVYSFANGAFIGGTLNHLGGHNPLEAAPYDVALAFGPNAHNIQDLVNRLIGDDACYTIRTGSDAANFLCEVFDRSEKVVRCAAGAKALWQQSFGASDRVVESLLKAGVFSAE